MANTHRHGMLEAAVIMIGYYGGAGLDIEAAVQTIIEASGLTTAKAMKKDGVDEYTIERLELYLEQ